MGNSGCEALLFVDVCDVFDADVLITDDEFAPFNKIPSGKSVTFDSFEFGCFSPFTNSFGTSNGLTELVP